MKIKIKETIRNYIRILKISKKPGKEEFWTTVRICLIGIAIIGFIGFLFYLVSVFIGG